MNEQAGSTREALRSAELVSGDLCVVLNNSMAAIEACRLQVLKHLARLSLSPLVIHRIEVVLEELISNVVRHGFRQCSDQLIVVFIASRKGRVEFTFEDDGLPFNLLDAPAPAPFTTLQEAKLGGLGIAMVRKLAADLRYEPIAPGACVRDFSGRRFEPRNRVLVTMATS